MQPQQQEQDCEVPSISSERSYGMERVRGHVPAYRTLACSVESGAFILPCADCSGCPSGVWRVGGLWGGILRSFHLPLYMTVAHADAGCRAERLRHTRRACISSCMMSHVRVSTGVLCQAVTRVTGAVK